MTPGGAEPRLLVHVCCGPCAIHPLQELGARYNTAAYFYNPNVHPADEYARRLSTAKRYCETQRIRFLTGPYDTVHYFHAIGDETDKPGRCTHCYGLRLSAAAATAHELSFEAFTTTLLVSPYQDRDAILTAGREAAGLSGVTFVEEDFRIGYRAGQRQAHALGMYCQRYCGCRFSAHEATAPADSRAGPRKDSRA